MRCVIFAHSTHGGGLQTVSIINKVAFAQVGFYLVKKYWIVSKKLIITLRHYIFMLLLVALSPSGGSQHTFTNLNQSDLGF